MFKRWIAWMFCLIMAALIPAALAEAAEPTDSVEQTKTLGEAAVNKESTDDVLAVSEDAALAPTGLAVPDSENSRKSDVSLKTEQSGEPMTFEYKQFTAVLGTVAFMDGEVEYRGETPYVIHNGEAQTPRVTVKDTDGNVMEEGRYTLTYRDNTNPGTAWVDVTVGSTTESLMFKIYLPATAKTEVENREDGIHLSWSAVEGAKGYVIYRRAWNLTSADWTTFERWNNTTQTEWTDTKVYAGTRYQYGVKAYFSDPMDNYNLGLVGPLKTTVRITTRTLLGVDAGKQQMTVRWSGSKYCTGYQIKYSTDPDFKTNVVAFKVTRPDAYRSTVKDLKSGTTYYVTVRSYQEFEGMTYFGEWSNVLSCKVG